MPKGSSPEAHRRGDEVSTGFSSIKVITVMNHLISEEVFLGFRTNFSRQGLENWLPEVIIDVSQAVGKATLKAAISQVRDAAALKEAEMVITLKRWAE